MPGPGRGAAGSIGAPPRVAGPGERYGSGRLRPVYFHPDELKGYVERVYRLPEVRATSERRGTPPPPREAPGEAHP